MDSIIAVDLTTGARTIFSDATTPNSTNALIYAGAITIDRQANRARVMDDSLDALLAVDQISGFRPRRWACFSFYKATLRRVACVSTLVSSNKNNARRPIAPPPPPSPVAGGVGGA